MKHYYIYLTTNLINGKIYIGKRTARTKTIEADYKYLGSGKLIRRAIKKYGKENFKKEILEVCTKENLSVREKYYIELYNCRNIETGYNIIEGGYGVGDLCHDMKTYYNPITDKEIRIKETEIPPDGFIHGRRPFTDEHKQKVASKGSKNGMYGSHRINKLCPTWGTTYIINQQTGEKLFWYKKDTLPQGYDYCPKYYKVLKQKQKHVQLLQNQLKQQVTPTNIIKAKLYLAEKDLYEYKYGIEYNKEIPQDIKQIVEEMLQTNIIKHEQKLLKRQQTRNNHKKINLLLP